VHGEVDCVLEWKEDAAGGGAGINDLRVMLACSFCCKIGQADEVRRFMICLKRIYNF
jgi:hypothetical protein